MGELADSARSIVSDRGLLSPIAVDFLDRISDLEHRHALALAELERMREVSKRREDDLNDQLQEAVGRSSFDGESAFTWQRRWFADKQRVDAAMAALSFLVGHAATVRHTWIVKPGESVRLNQKPNNHTIENSGDHDVIALVLDETMKFNPDLLERASTLLAEAYIEAKKAEGK